MYHISLTLAAEDRLVHLTHNLFVGLLRVRFAHGHAGCIATGPTDY